MKKGFKWMRCKIPEESGALEALTWLNAWDVTAASRRNQDHI